MKPLLSIVVPTKDRYKYLKHLIALIDSFHSKDIELVLQDNTANNAEILEFLKQKEYPYIKYAHRAEQIPVFYNADLAVLNASGEYVCLIGDDDGVTKHIIDCVKWMKNNDIDVVVPAFIQYLWPDFNDKSFGKHSAIVTYEIFSNKREIVNINDALNKSLKEGFINRGILPSVYHGIVKRNILDNIYHVGGTFFPGASPDIACGVALCFTANKYARVDFPIVISGASAEHGGGIRKLKDKLAQIEALPFLPHNAKDNWEKNIPKIWSGETVWPESAIKALRYMGRADLIKKVNFEFAQARFIMAHPAYWRLAFKVTNNYLKLFYYLIKIYSIRIMNYILRRLKSNNQIIAHHNMKDIQEVQACLLKQYPSFDIK